MKTISAVTLSAVLGLFLGLAGCNKGEPAATTYPVTGTVMLGDTKLEKGTIVFDSADGKGNSYQGEVKDGAFAFETSEGKKTVRVNSVQETGEKDQYGSVISKDIIPSDFKQEVEVKKDGENKFEVKIPAAAK